MAEEIDVEDVAAEFADIENVGLGLTPDETPPEATPEDSPSPQGEAAAAADGPEPSDNDVVYKGRRERSEGEDDGPPVKKSREEGEADRPRRAGRTAGTAGETEAASGRSSGAEQEDARSPERKAKKEFLSLLEGQKHLTRKSKWKEVKEGLREDERYKSVDSDTREKMFKEYVEKLSDETASDAEEEDDRKRRLKEKEAMEERERQVAAERGELMSERKKETDKYRLAEHEESYKALLLDLIRNPDQSWQEARRVLRKDERYANCDLLDKEMKENLYIDHSRHLEKKRREAFFVALSDHPEINMHMRWKDAEKIIEKDEAFAKVKHSSDRKVERDFRDWTEDKRDRTVKEFKELLNETKIITYKSKKIMEEGEQHLKDILAVLQNDKRYLDMKELASERDKILDDYIDKLDRQGPPPPPTQQEGERRRERREDRDRE